MNGRARTGLACSGSFDFPVRCRNKLLILRCRLSVKKQNNSSINQKKHLTKRFMLRGKSIFSKGTAKTPEKL
ncbi:MAG: hypothetical protein IK141_04610 [Clostridia bacterium]|nr:hypothetical protein [Clostridia bacterium]